MGLGNNTLFQSVNSDMTLKEKRACNSKRMEKIRKAHCLIKILQFFEGSGVMKILILYSDEPLTIASIFPFEMARWQTEPLRT